MRPLLAIALLAAGCLPQATGYHCGTSSDCVHAGVQGTCEPVGLCSFPDTGCSSGRRFGEQSGAQSNQCVGAGDAGVDATDAPPGHFTIGGTVTGLTSGTVVLQDNGADTLSRSSNGAFTFATSLTTGQSYNATIMSAPAGQSCGIANASGVIVSANITDIAVTCFPTGGDPGILCSVGTYCTVGTQDCCFDRAVGHGSCVAPTTSCATQTLQCDDAADCGGGTNVCCAQKSTMTGNLVGVSCKISASACLNGVGNNTYEIWCDPTATTPCPGGMTCVGSTGFTGYYKCQ